MDRYAVPMLLHRFAIYLHEGRQFQVETLDYEDKKGYVRAVDVDYYTDADTITSMKVLDVFDDGSLGTFDRARGEVLVSAMVRIFKKIKLDTHENLGWGPVSLPETEMQTTACWWVLPDELVNRYEKDLFQGAMLGLAHLLRIIAPVHLMCSARDLSVSYHVRDPFTRMPTIYLYDTMPGGIGLSERVYETGLLLFEQARALLKECSCEAGCPSCVGPSAGKEAKGTLEKVFGELLG